jgi:hypothetical protein
MVPDESLWGCLGIDIDWMGYMIGLIPLIQRPMLMLVSPREPQTLIFSLKAVVSFSLHLSRIPLSQTLPLQLSHHTMYPILSI